MTIESHVVWDELDNYVRQLGVENVFCEEESLVDMLAELHEEWKESEIRPHIKTWLAQSTRISR